MASLYDPIRRKPYRPAPDWKLWGTLAICLAVAVAVLTPVLQMIGYERDFRSFIAQLSTDTVYAYEQDALVVTQDGVTRQGEGKGGYTLYGCIVRAGVGKPRTDLPAEEPITVNYGNGSSLQLWEVPMPERGARHPRGVLVHYTAPDGSQYTYDSDMLQFYEVVNSLR